MTKFKNLTSIKEIDTFIMNNRLSFLYISKKNCSVCVGLMPQISAMFEKYPEIKTAHIDTDIVPEIAGQFSIFTVPVLLLLVNGKEYIREARIVHTAILDERISQIYENRFDFD